MDLGIEGDAALVAASSSGLGKASARALAREGANVIINGRDPERLADARSDIEAVAAGEVVARPGDLTDPDDCEALVEAAVSEFGGLDHLVTNAGGPPPGAFLDLDDGDWAAAFDLLVMSAVRLIRESAPHLEDGGGTIVTIASRSVKEAIDGLVLSNSVRSGVIGLEKTLSRELAPGVRSNAVLPGLHETDRLRGVLEGEVEAGEHDSYEDALDARGGDVPLGRIGDPETFGEVVAFLSSPRASYVNGVAVPVDGGLGRSNV